MHTLRLTPALRQAVSARVIQAIGLVQLSGAELAEALALAAAENPFLRYTPPGNGLSPDFDLVAAPAPGLHAHVSAQLGQEAADPTDARLVAGFLEALEPTGWLGRPVAEIAAEAGSTEARAQEVLARLQQIEPAGLFARGLAECLRLQAQDRGQLTPEMARVLAHLPELAKGPTALAAATGLARDEVEICLARLRRMDPKPGLAFEPAPGPVREPDLIAARTPQGWSVDLNRAALPALAVADPVANPGADLRPALDEARWLVRALDQRGQTLLAIGARVVAAQTAYLTGASGFLAPFLLADVAEALDLHPSTVSRAVSGLLIDTPRGIQPARALFAAPVAAAGGVSASAVSHRLGQLVAAEDPAAPLDDDSLATRLAAEGLAVSRRTVAKYRSRLGLPPAQARRRASPAGAAEKETCHVPPVREPGSAPLHQRHTPDAPERPKHLDPSGTGVLGHSRPDVGRRGPDNTGDGLETPRRSA